MISRICRPAAVAGILTGLLLICAPPIARADLEVSFSIDGGLPVLVADNPVDFSSAGFNGTFGTFKIVFFGTTSDNTAAESDLMTSTTSIKNTDTKSHTLTIAVTQDNYTLPGTIGTLLDMTSHIGGTVTMGGPGQMLTFQSYANNSNNPFDTVGASTTGPQSPNISVTKSSFDSMPDPSTPFLRTNGLYSVTTTNTITLVSGGIFNFSTSTTLAESATPAPAGLILAAAAVPALTLGFWLRRRQIRSLARSSGA